MGIADFPKVSGDENIEELRNLVAMLIKEVEFLANGNISSQNIREIAGYKVNVNELKHKSGIVGLNGANPNTPTEVRMWAGSATPAAAPFRVQQNGKMYATGATIENSATGERVVIDNTGLHTYDATGVERLTIGVAPVKGVKAVTFRNTVGAESGLMTYGTETVDFASRTGIYIVGPDAQYLLFEEDGTFHIQDQLGRGFRTSSGFPQMSSGGAWVNIAPAFSGVSGTVYVASTSGGPTTTPITFTNGVRTS